MKAVILAAGKGTRLRPLTIDTPKGLVEINSKPLMTHILNSVKEYVTEIIIVVGYLGNLIEEYYENKYESIPIKYVHQEDQLGTGHALLCAKKYLDDEFLVINGDDIYHREDIEKLSKVKFGVLGMRVENWQHFGVLVQNSTNKSLRKIVEKPTSYISSIANTGVYKLSPIIFNHLLVQSMRAEYEIVDYINYLINNNYKVEVLEIQKYWYPVNSLEQLYEAEEGLKTTNNLL